MHQRGSHRKSALSAIPLPRGNMQKHYQNLPTLSPEIPNFPIEIGDFVRSQIRGLGFLMMIERERESTFGG